MQPCARNYWNSQLTGLYSSVFHMKLKDQFQNKPITEVDGKIFMADF